MVSIRGATIGMGLGMIAMGLLRSSTLATSSAAVGLTRATGNPWGGKPPHLHGAVH